MIVLLDPEEDHDDILRANRSRERKYMFDVVSDARADQQDVYAATAKILIGSVLEGYNATVFAYGATGRANSGHPHDHAFVSFKERAKRTRCWARKTIRVSCSEHYTISLSKSRNSKANANIKCPCRTWRSTMN